MGEGQHRAEDSQCLALRFFGSAAPSLPLPSGHLYEAAIVTDHFVSDKVTKR